MKISDLSSGERSHLEEIRAISKDSEGRDVLVGLDIDETSIYLKYQAERLSGKDGLTDGETFLKLADKHEKARLEVLATEYIIRTENPDIH